ncbi:hypothetical protein Tcan_17760 [Toxocara canis]|uniref:Uncharacterized protein n=1 Tax=Toxocara canis TaxID=6265 RepID=A0A0B2VK95_TOXCA|nr:hypothetical protein Tcan_17760 [Toxocara canis]
MRSHSSRSISARLHELSERLTSIKMDLLAERRRRHNAEELLKGIENKSSAVNVELSKCRLRLNELLEERAKLTSQVERLEGVCRDERMMNNRVMSVNHELQQQCFRWKMSNLRLLEMAKEFRDELKVAHEVLRSADMMLEFRNSDTTTEDSPSRSQTVQILHRFEDITKALTMPITSDPFS